MGETQVTKVQLHGRPSVLCYICKGVSYEVILAPKQYVLGRCVQ